MIDVTVQGSPGFWMLALWKKLQAEQPRLRRLDDYRCGRPPLVLGSERLQSAFYRFQSMSKSNFAESIITARTNRMVMRSINTSAVADANGDQQAWRMWTANHMDIGATDVHDDMATFGVGYVAVGAPDVNDPDGWPVITVEDPRQTITAQDPVNKMKTIAGFKLFHDDLRDMDYAYLWLPGQMWVAYRPRKARVSVAQVDRDPSGRPGLTPVAFNPASFTLLPVGQQAPDGPVFDDDQPDGVIDPAELPPGYQGPTSEQYEVLDVPVVRYGNRRGVGEFEHHTDLLDRINHGILNKIVIVTLQAFKQRAIELDPTVGDEDGGLPDEDENGQPINYNNVFEADPGALWRLPLGAKIWESGQVDMSGILGSVTNDVMILSQVTTTPFPMFTPDGANQSASGASLYREGLTFRSEDLCLIAGRGHSQVVALGFAFKGDATRANPEDVNVSWAPAERYSILEQAQADSLSASLPRAQKFARIYGMSPAEVQIALAQSSADAMLGMLSKPPADPVQHVANVLGTGAPSDGTGQPAAS